MENIEYKLEGTKLTLSIDTARRLGPSASGKTIVIATTRGNQVVGQTKESKPIILGLNLYTK